MQGPSTSFLATLLALVLYFSVSGRRCCAKCRFLYLVVCLFWGDLALVIFYILGSMYAQCCVAALQGELMLQKILCIADELCIQISLFIRVKPLKKTVARNIQK